LLLYFAAVLPTVGYTPTPEHLKGKCVGAGREPVGSIRFTIALATPRGFKSVLSSTGSAIEHWQCYRALAVLAFGRRRHRRLLGWIATWSEPGPTLVIGAIEEEPFDIWPVAQLLGCAHAEQEGAETLTPLLRRKTLIGSGSEECPTCAPNQRPSPAAGDGHWSRDI
jgi:hypothetical protein